MAEFESVLGEIAQLALAMIDFVPTWVLPIAGLGIYLLARSGSEKSSARTSSIDKIAVVLAALGLSATLYQIQSSDEDRNIAFASRVSTFALGVEDATEVRVRNANQADTHVLILIKALQGGDHPNLNTWIPACSEIAVRITPPIPREWTVLVIKDDRFWTVGADARRAPSRIYETYGKAEGWRHRIWSRPASGETTALSACSG